MQNTNYKTTLQNIKFFSKTWPSTKTWSTQYTLWKRRKSKNYNQSWTSFLELLICVTSLEWIQKSTMFCTPSMLWLVLARTHSKRVTVTFCWELSFRKKVGSIRQSPVFKKAPKSEDSLQETACSTSECCTDWWGTCQTHFKPSKCL